MRVVAQFARVWVAIVVWFGLVSSEDLWIVVGSTFCCYPDVLIICYLVKQKERFKARY